MRRFAAFVAVGVLAFVAPLLGRTALVYVAGAPPLLRVAVLQSGQELCQGPISLPEGAEFERVRLRGAGEFVVSVKDDRGQTLGEGRARADGRDVTGDVGEITSGRPLRVCIRGVGAFYGAPATATSFATTLDGADTIYDLTLRLERSQRTTLIAELPRMLERAAVFNAGGPLLYAVLGLALLLGVPALLYSATRSTQSNSPEAHNDETS